MSNIQHVIITRCNFSNDDLFKKYFHVMKQTYIPSINAQTNKNFTIALLINERHFDEVKNLFDKNIKVISFNTKEDYKKYVIENKVKIQTRHDCDDLMLPNYVEFIQNKVNQNLSYNDNFIITFQPTKLDFTSGKEYTHSRDYSKVCSMFSTLVQNDVKNSVMDVMHDHLSRLTRNIIYVKETYVKLVLHGNNTLSKLNANDKLIQ